jgi:predicted  nucleic acid-binding Zn-ribbon protein
MDRQEAIRKLAAHAVVLRAGGAPHQQELAEWLEAVTQHVVDDETDSARLETLRGNVAAIIDERDSARDACDAAARRIEELEKQLEEARATNKAPDGFVGVAEDVPEEGHAALKAKAKSKAPSGKST